MAATEGFGLRRLGVQVALVGLVLVVVLTGFGNPSFAAVAPLLVLGGLVSTGGWGYRWDETTSS
ncbi:hypothetical protein [Halococcus salsus]|uniref:hypothetical protein n=1 Tax=Halococcus salsus TaxID=2162894 RepID=UPI001356C33A|nr:hypothetical protein [Halococcus salsus]